MQKFSHQAVQGHVELITSDNAAESRPVQDLTAVFGGFTTRLRGVLGDNAWRAWAAGLRVGHADDERVVLFAPSAAHRERMLDRVGPRRLSALWADEDPLARAVEIQTDPNPKTTVSANDAGSAAGDGCGPSVARLRNFSNFVIGSANKAAAIAAKAMAEDANPPCSAMVIYGDPGVGKTHLLTAMEAAAVAARPHHKVMFFNADRFRAEYVRAITENAALSFKDEVSQADLLLIDDIHLIAGAKSTQTELSHIISAVLANGGRVVVAADRRADEIIGLDERLAKRLSATVSCGLGKPDLPLRRRILERMVADNPGMRRNKTVPDEVVDYIACAVKDTPRALEAALATVLLQTVLVDKPVTRETATEALGDMIAVSNRRVTVDEIQKTVAEYHGMKLADLLSKRRTHDIVRPRQQAMYLAKTLTNRSLPDIARRFGGMDHTTVLHAVRRIDEMCGSDPRMRSDVDAIRRRLRQRAEGAAAH